MRIQDILAHKRDGLELNDEELAFFVGAVSDNTASMEQVGASHGDIHQRNDKERKLHLPDT